MTIREARAHLRARAAMTEGCDDMGATRMWRHLAAVRRSRVSRPTIVEDALHVVGCGDYDDEADLARTVAAVETVVRRDLDHLAALPRTPRNVRLAARLRAACPGAAR